MKAAQKQANNKSNHSTTEATQTSWQSQLAQVANNSEEAVAQRALISGISDSPRILAQRLRIESYISTGQQQTSIHSALPITQPPIQRLEKPDDEEKELLQRKPNPESTVQLEQEFAPKPNNTGLPDNLKSGIESLSGLSMDNVKVHYNSPQPAQLNALAYAQGTDIHIAPGQEQHLPHETWHVVQQAQGRVKPTMQMKNGISVNDDQALEYEADVMGIKAAASEGVTNHVNEKAQSESVAMNVRGSVQRMGLQVIQRVKVGGAGAGVIFLATTKFPAAVYNTARTILAEMQAAGTDYDSVDAVVIAVNADQRMIDALAAEALAEAARQAAAAAAAEAAAAVEAARQATALLVDYGGGRQLRQYDVTHGIWELIPGRVNGDRQLRITLAGVEYAYHVHPPQLQGRDPIPGQVMRGWHMTNTPTPRDVITAILAEHGRPAGW